MTSNREIVLGWMMDVIQEYHAGVIDSFGLSVKIYDAVLKQLPLSTESLQLLAAVSMLISSKFLTNVIPFKISSLIYYSEDFLTYTDIVEMERIVLFLLDWKIFKIT